MIGGRDGKDTVGMGKSRKVKQNRKRTVMKWEGDDGKGKEGRWVKLQWER